MPPTPLGRERVYRERVDCWAFVSGGRKRDDEPEPFIGGVVVVVVSPLGRGGGYRRYRDDGIRFPDFDLDE